MSASNTEGDAERYDWKTRQWYEESDDWNYTPEREARALHRELPDTEQVFYSEFGAGRNDWIVVDDQHSFWIEDQR